MLSFSAIHNWKWAIYEPKKSFQHTFQLNNIFARRDYLMLCSGSDQLEQFIVVKNKNSMHTQTSHYVFNGHTFYFFQMHYSMNPTNKQTI